ncbi:MAG: hypothetical protein PHT48_01090 [Dechloromonas sp.]|nr:hypothetical protein [Dechloromonas sp.]
MTTPSHSHHWEFFSAGGFDQVRIDRGSDLTHLSELNQKLWVALSCPVNGLEFDPATLSLLDSDGDGHIRAPELIAAIEWAEHLLKSADTLMAGGDLALDDIDDSHADGLRLLASARHILSSLDKPEAKHIGVDDTADSVRIFASTLRNGDGIISRIEHDDALQQTLSDIITYLGGVTDRSGEAGVDQAMVDRFFSEAAALQAWRDAPAGDASLQPLGEQSAIAHAALLGVKGKIDDFFTRCRLADFDPRASQLLNGSEDDLRAIGQRNLAESVADLATLPLAFVRNGGQLPLDKGLNPAWEDAMAMARSTAITPILGEISALTASDWATVKGRFSPYENWLAAHPATPLDNLASERLQQLLASDHAARLSALIAEDAAMADAAAAIAEVDQLTRLTRDLAKIANNFVSFTDFYTRRDLAIFQAGTLYLDGRSCELTVKVLDAGKHAALAALSGVYLAYCDCRRQGEKMTIAAAFTAGDSDQLMVGRNGVFYDRDGKDWDATITKIIDHPISIRQAFWSPYKKLARLIAEQAQKFAADKAKGVDDLSAKAVGEAGQRVSSGDKAAPAPFDVARFAGIFAAIGLAVGALGTALAALVTGFLGLKLWQMPLALGGLMLLVSGPAMAMAFFKLRNRNLGPILDANGWAVNTRARINIPFGRALTQMAALPTGARRNLTDPYAEKKTPWLLYFFLGAVLMLGLLYLGTGTLPGL